MEKKKATPPRVTIACPCGAEVLVDPRSRNGIYICSSCKAPLQLTPPRRVSPKGDAPARGKPRPPPELGVHEVECRCGERLRVRMEHLGRVARCPRCGIQLKLEKARDPQTLDIHIRASEVTPSKESPPAEAPKRKTEPRPKAPGRARAESASLLKIPTGARPLSCRCGASLMVLPEHLGKQAQCPQCGLVMRLYSYHDPTTHSVAITAEPVTGTGGTPDEGASIASQELLCQCGEHLLVSAEHLGKQVQCAACGTIMKIEKAIDPVTSAPTIRASVVGKVDLDSWSLDDFK